MNRRGILWVCAALATIAASAAVAWAASQLAAQRIGLTSEPLSVASSLAPPATTSKPPPARPRRPVVVHRRTAAPAPAATPPAVAGPPVSAPSISPAVQSAGPAGQPATTTTAAPARVVRKPTPSFQQHRDDSSSDRTSGSRHSRDD